MKKTTQDLLRRVLPLVLAVAGLGLTSLLQFVHYRSYTRPSDASVCSGSGAFDCAAVTQSAYAVWFGLPLSIWGVVLYVALTFAARRRSVLLLPLSGLAAVGGVALTILQIAVIGAICFLCEGVHLISLGLFAASWWSRRELLRDEKEPAALLEILGAPAVIVAIVLVYLPNYWGTFTWKAALPYSSGKTEDGAPWVGASSPVVTVEEYTDYSCPHCRVGSSRSLRLLESHPTTLRIVRRHLPRTRCTPGTATCQPLRVALCAEQQGRFWRMDRWLFHHAAGKPRVELEEAARDVGVNLEKLRSCLSRAETYRRANELLARAQKQRVTATPTYFVNGKRTLASELEQKLRKHLGG